MNLQRVTDKLKVFLFGGMDPIRLDVFRRLLSLTLIAYVVERARTPFEWLTHEGFHPSPETQHWFLPPTAPVMPTWLVFPFLTFFLACALALVLGRYVRVCTWLVLACTLYITSADYASAFTQNIFYIVSFLVLALAPPPRAFRVGDRDVVVHPAWPVRILQLTLLIQYCTAGTCKVLFGDWIASGGLIQRRGESMGLVPPTHWFKPENLDVLWTQTQGIYCTAPCAWMLRTVPVWSWTLMQYPSLLFELLAPVVIGVRRLRPLGYVWGSSFLIIIALMMHNLTFFVAQLLCFFVLFMQPANLHRIRSFFQRSAIGAFLFSKSA